MEKKFKVYCLRDIYGSIVYIGATRCSLSVRYGKRYKTFDCTKYKIELVDSFDTEREMFELESKLIKHYGIENLLNKVETTSTGYNPKGLDHVGCFKKGSNGDDRFGDKRKKAVSESLSVPILCLTNNKFYKSISEAAKELNLEASNVHKVLNNLRTHTGGYKFVRVNHANTEG